MPLLFLAYVFLYPALQIYTLWRCKGGYRIASLLGLVPLGPFYLWSLYKVFFPQPSGDLSAILILGVAPLSLLYLGLVATRDRAAAAAAAAVSHSSSAE